MEILSMTRVRKCAVWDEGTPHVCLPGSKNISKEIFSSIIAMATYKSSL